MHTTLAHLRSGAGNIGEAVSGHVSSAATTAASRRGSHQWNSKPSFQQPVRRISEPLPMSVPAAWEGEWNTESKAASISAQQHWLPPTVPR